LVTLLGSMLAQLIGWPLETGLVFGLGLSVASTVVVLWAFLEPGSLSCYRCGGVASIY
jgi:CPA2 family monovalent cation:H+ antiporter-2